MEGREVPGERGCVGVGVGEATGVLVGTAVEVGVGEDGVQATASRRATRAIPNVR